MKSRVSESVRWKNGRVEEWNIGLLGRMITKACVTPSVIEGSALCGGV